MIRIIALGGILVLAEGRNGVMAQEVVPAETRNGAMERGVDSIFAPWSRTTTPGCAVGIDKGGIPLLRRSYGMANLETRTPWTTNTISESGSVAKQFTAAAVVLLAQDGVLSLNDDIVKWIPEVKGFGRKITVRHLLTHTSGLPDRYTLHDFQNRPAGQTDHENREVVAMLTRMRDLNFDPGEDYEYSNTGYIVAATIVERASGKSLQTFTNERMFRPWAWRILAGERTIASSSRGARLPTVAASARDSGTIIRSPVCSGAAAFSPPSAIS